MYKFKFTGLISVFLRLYVQIWHKGSLWDTEGTLVISQGHGVIKCFIYMTINDVGQHLP